MPILVGVVAIAGAIGATLAAVFGPLYLALFRRELDRAAEMEDVARSLGLTFSRHDPAYPSSTAFRFPFELFSRGVDHTCENFMSGRSGDIEIVAFDFLYRQRFDSDGAPHNDLDSEPIRWSCALTTVPGWRPHVVIEPASSSRTARADGEPVRLEWGDFNARYRVVSPERGFAAALLDVELMGWLVDDAPRLPLTWEVQRDHVLCRAPGLDPGRYAELIRATAEFARRIARGASN
jgi:hypothetical protein